MPDGMPGGIVRRHCQEALSGGIAGRNRQLEYGPRGKKKNLPRCVPLYYPDFEMYAKYTSCRVMMLVSGGLGGHGTVRSPFLGVSKKKRRERETTCLYSGRVFPPSHLVLP